MIRATLVILLLLSACAKPPQPVWTEMPTADQLLERLNEASGRFHSLDAEVSVSLSVHGKYLSSHQFLLVERPDRFRADVLTGFGQMVLQLTSNGKQLAVFLNTEVPGRFLRGPATDENIARFTRVPLPVASLIRLLLYDPPLIETGHSLVIPQDEKLLLTLENAERRQELLFDRQLHLVTCRYLAGDELLLEVDYQKIEKDGFPRSVRINLAKEQTNVTLHFSDLKTNVNIVPEKFVLKKPDNLKIEPLP